MHTTLVVCIIYIYNSNYIIIYARILRSYAYSILSVRVVVCILERVHMFSSSSVFMLIHLMMDAYSRYELVLE